jgi:hypothetical protein
MYPVSPNMHMHTRTVHSLSLRVNGVVYKSIELRHMLQDGFPGGDWEIVVVDPFAGEFAVSAGCELELQSGDGPWTRYTVKQAVALLQQSE